MKPRIPDHLRGEIALRIKNKLDISDLIKDYSIAGEDLTGAVIEEFNRVGEDISKAVLTNTVIGKEGKETHISRSIARGCNFRAARFLGRVIAKKVDFSYSSFIDTYIPYCDYRFSNFTGCSFCGTVFSFSTSMAVGSKFDGKFISELGKIWNLKIGVLKEE